jgi:hypothetical protein
MCQPLAANGPMTLRADGATAIFRRIDGRVGGIFAIADPIKATTRRRWPPCKRGHPRRHADRRQPDHRRGGGAETRHR